MRYGVVLSGIEADVHTLIELAGEAESAGWDGVFLWDMILGMDVWVMFAAMAMRTQRLRFGTLLTPPSRRRPWKLANEAATLAHLSNGRFILSVGLGAAGPDHPNSEFGKVGEQTERKIRVKLMDEALDILTGLWSGKPFHYDGDHYHLQDISYPLPPKERIPIWVVGAWPREKSMQRVIRYDGVLPEGMREDRTRFNPSYDDIRAMKHYIEERRTQSTPFDIVIQGETPGENREAELRVVRDFAQAGATWWLENVWNTRWAEQGVKGLRTRIQQGPPRI